MKFVLGIDPGKTGAMAFLDEEGDVFEVRDMPETTSDICSLISEFMLLGGIQYAVLEKQQAMPAQGVTSVFTLGSHYGELRGILTAYGIPFIEPRPLEWKKHHRLTGKVGQDKNASRGLAQQLFPGAALDRVKDHGRAEALLLAAFGYAKT